MASQLENYQRQIDRLKADLDRDLMPARAACESLVEYVQERGTQDPLDPRNAKHISNPYATSKTFCTII